MKSHSHGNAAANFYCIQCAIINCDAVSAGHKGRGAGLIAEHHHGAEEVLQSPLPLQQR